MPIVLKLRKPLSFPLEVERFRLSIAKTQSVAEIGQTPVLYGSQDGRLADFFEVTGSATDDQTAVWQGDLSRVKRLGEQHDAGMLRVEGSVGMHVGARMSGGEILVTGDAGDWAGAEMRGGRLTVQGSVGDCAGGAYRGARRGMRGGELLIWGDAGDELGHTMRRGLIAVAGKAGAMAGCNLLAGTIVFGGLVEAPLGLGNRRGTLLLLHAGQPCLLPTYRPSVQNKPVITRLILRRLRELGFPLPRLPQAMLVNRWTGDHLEGGRGEVLCVVE